MGARVAHDHHLDIEYDSNTQLSHAEYLEWRQVWFTIILMDGYASALTRFI
jgi:hypothetical protein